MAILNTSKEDSISRRSSDQSQTYSLWQGFATSLAAFLVANIALGLFLYSLLEFLTPNADRDNSFSLLLLASGFFTVAFLLIPPAILAFWRVIGQPIPAWIYRLRLPPLSVLLILYPLVLLLGNWVSGHLMSAFLFLPFLHIMAIGIPIAVILKISLGGLNATSLQRKWGVFSVGLTLSPLTIFVLELFAFVFPLLLLTIWISRDPERVEQLRQLSETLRQPFADPNELVRLLQPYLIEPAVVLTFLFFAALVVPLIEEAIKPLGVWMIYGRTKGELDGFVSGALCGGGYALLESFMLGSTNTEWLVAVIGRSGTGAIHVFTTALVGAALTGAWQSRRYLRLLIAYGVSVFFHGIWNGFAILAALRGLYETEQGFWSLPFVANLALTAPLFIVILACLAILGLWIFNRRIQKDWSTIVSTE